MLQHVLNSQNSTLNPLTLSGSQCNAPQMEISGCWPKNAVHVHAHGRKSMIVQLS